MRKIFVLILTTFWITNSHAFVKEEAEAFCSSYKKGVESQPLPVKAADGSIVFKYDISCSTLIAKHYREIPNQYISALKTNTKANSIHFYCDAMGSSRHYGMTFSDIYYDMNMKYLTTITVTPNDCK